MTFLCNKSQANKWSRLGSLLTVQRGLGLCSGGTIEKAARQLSASNWFLPLLSGEKNWAFQKTQSKLKKTLCKYVQKCLRRAGTQVPRMCKICTANAIFVLFESVYFAATPNCWLLRPCCNCFGASHISQSQQESENRNFTVLLYAWMYFHLHVCLFPLNMFLWSALWRSCSLEVEKGIPKFGNCWDFHFHFLIHRALPWAM